MDRGEDILFLGGMGQGFRNALRREEEERAAERGSGVTLLLSFPGCGETDRNSGLDG